jgi:cyclophilin family peptidyl-prolyl cis-trans isomerase
MIQGGGMLENLTEKPTRGPVFNEAPQTYKAGLKNTRGTIAMARTNDPHSATAQFYINLADNTPLDPHGIGEEGYGYCVFGRVVSGMEAVDKIAKVKTEWRRGMGDVPQFAVRIKDAVLLPAQPWGLCRSWGMKMAPRMEAMTLETRAPNKPAQKPLTVKARPSFGARAPASQKTRPLMTRLKQPREQAMGMMAMTFSAMPTVAFRAARITATISRSRKEPWPSPGTKEQATSRPMAEKRKRSRVVMRASRPSRWPG